MKELKDPRKNPEVWRIFPAECPVDGSYLARWLDGDKWVDDYVRLEGGEWVSTQLGLGTDCADFGTGWDAILNRYGPNLNAHIYGPLGMSE